MNTKTKTLNIISTQKLSIFALLLIVLSIFTYLFLYQNSVNAAYKIQTLEEDISNIKSKISDKEFQIVEKKKEIDRDIAIEKGFVPLGEVAFVKKVSVTALNAGSN